jgi:hypothetical protein
MDMNKVLFAGLNIKDTLLIVGVAFLVYKAVK